MNGEDQVVVLIVEDEPVVRMAAVKWISHAGFETLEAPNAHAALEVLEATPDVAILFTDVDMPGEIDGLGLANIVHERWPHIKLLVTSGRVELRDADLPDHGRFLGKPYSSETIRRAVRKASPRPVRARVSLTSLELTDLLRFLDLTTADLALLTDTDEAWCERLVTGAEPIPHWLSVLAVYWSYYEEALQIAWNFVEDADGEEPEVVSLIDRPSQGSA